MAHFRATTRGWTGEQRLIDYGYARVSTSEQDAQLQLDALTAAGVPAGNIHVDRASGARDDRPALLQVLAKVGRETG
jgi:DNA invertase Pin-like site-specific DNA recombinase